MNVIVQLEYELAYYDSAVQRFYHYTTMTPPMAICVQILDKAIYISHGANKFRKIWILLFFLQLWVNSRVDWALQPWYGNLSRRKTVQLCLKINLVLHPVCAVGLGKYIYVIFIFIPSKCDFKWIFFKSNIIFALQKVLSLIKL